MLVVLAGILPIMISMKQRGYYILSVYPFFALSAGYFLLPILDPWIDKLKGIWLKIMAGIINQNLRSNISMIANFQLRSTIKKTTITNNRILTNDNIPRLKEISPDMNPGTPAELTDVTCDGVDGDCDGPSDEDYVPDGSCGRASAASSRRRVAGSTSWSWPGRTSSAAPRPR